MSKDRARAIRRRDQEDALRRLRHRARGQASGFVQAVGFLLIVGTILSTGLAGALWVVILLR